MNSTNAPQSDATKNPGSAAEVFQVFLRLGLTSFGGPVAHIGYFRDEFVRRRRWLDEAAYAEVVALCQVGNRSISQLSKELGLTARQWMHRAEVDAGR